MMALTWTPALATGVPTVDEQHKELFRQTAKLKEAMAQGKGRAEIERIFAFLQDYVVKHFREEERVMDERHCSAAAENKAAHAALLARVSEFKRQLDAAGPTAPLVLEIHDTLCRWLVTHIQGIDVQLQPHPVLT